MFGMGLQLLNGATDFNPLTRMPDVRRMYHSVLSGITQSGGNVSQWNDFSAYAAHATSSGANRPVTGAATQNGHNVLTGAGAAFMDFASLSLTGDAWAFAAVANNDASSGSIVLTTAATNAYLLGMTSGSSGSVINSIAGSSRDLTGLGSGTSNNTMHVIGTYTDVSGNFHIFYDGTDSGPLSPVSSINLTGLFDYGVSAYRLDGKVGEVEVGQGRLSSGLVLAMYGYMKNYWATP